MMDLTGLLRMFLGIVFITLILFTCSKTFAQDCTDPHEQCGHEDPIGKVSSNTITDSDKAYVFGLGGGDMEINGCLATFSWLFGLRQDAKLNPDCEAAKEAGRLDAEGHYLAAAKMRCSTKQYRKVFGKGQSCVDAIIYVPPNNPEPDPVPDDELIDYVAQQEELEYVKEELAAIIQQVEQQQAAPQQQQVQRQVQQQIDSDAKRRAKAREALEGGK